MEMQGIGILAFAFVTAFFVVRILKPVAYYIELVDKPGGRKHHEGVVPLIGGIAIYTAVCMATFLFIEQPLFIRLFLLAGGLIVFMGSLDDRYQISARFRLVGQFLISCLFVYGLDVHIHTFGDLFGLGNIYPGWWGYPLAVLSLMGIVNAMNMLDGMDGLVGTVSIVSFIGLVGLFGLNGNITLQFLSLSFIGATAAFLIFNIWGSDKRKFQKVFMGDAGSMFLGLALGVLLIKGSQSSSPAFSPVVALWFVLLPMTDMFTIMYRRFRRGKSPMAPDRTHIHHILTRAGFSSRQTLYILILAQALFVCIGIFMMKSDAPDLISFLSALSFVVAYQLLLKRSWKFLRWSKRNLLSSLQENT